MATQGFVTIEIVRFADDAQPGWVEARLVDAAGHAHVFVEKAPVVSAQPLDRESVYPCEGVIACSVEKSWTDAAGRQLTQIDTATPWEVASQEGLTRFEVLREQLWDEEARGSSDTSRCTRMGLRQPRLQPPQSLDLDGPPVVTP